MILVIGGNNQGKKDYAKTLFPDAEIWDKLHLYIKEQLEKGLSEEEIFFEIKEKNKEGQWVLIADEIGNGVVPMDLADRKWRDVSGRILIDLAKEASEVHRVVCGIGQKIKG